MSSSPPSEDASVSTGSRPHGQLDELLDELNAIRDDADPDLQEQIDNAIDTASELRTGVFGHVIKKYTTRDIAEAVVGSILLSLPLLVEDGVFDIADFFVETTVLGVPGVFLALNALFVILITIGLLYWADFQKIVPKRPFFGFIPRRLVGVLVISFMTSTMMMTMWGRVEGWEDPAIALARISCIWAAAAFGAALGDILPGPSQGVDISEKLNRS